MTQRPTGPATGPEHERRAGRRITTPIIIAIAVVALIMALAFGIARPWEGGSGTARTGTVVPTAPR